MNKINDICPVCGEKSPKTKGFMQLPDGGVMEYKYHKCRNKKCILNKK